MAYKVQQFKSRLSQYKFGGEIVLTVFFFFKNGIDNSLYLFHLSMYTLWV